MRCVTKSNLQAFLDFYVTKDNDAKALLGIETCEALDLVLRKVRSISKSNSEKAMFAEKNIDVFMNGGIIPGVIQNFTTETLSTCFK